MSNIIPNYFGTQHQVPKFIFVQILSYLELVDLARSSQVNKCWNQLAKNQLLRALNSFTKCCKENNIEFGSNQFFTRLIYGEDQMLERIKSCFETILPNKMKVFECRFLFHADHYVTVQGSNNSPPPCMCEVTKEVYFFLKKLKDDSVIFNCHGGRFFCKTSSFKGYYITLYCLPDETDKSDLLCKKIENVVEFLLSK